MTHSVSNLHDAQTVIVGVDTHKHMHVAVAIDSRGIRLGAHSFGADSEGYRARLTWAEAYGGIEAVGIEGTGGYGVGLSRTVHRAGHRVVEVNRVDRRLRRAAGKSDTIDAEAAARAVLAGQATARSPKTADGAVEMMRQLKVARDSAVKARTTAMSTLQQILVNAPPVLREPLQALTDRALERQPRAQEALSLPGRQAKHQAQGDRRLDGVVRVLALSAWLPARRPRRVPVGELAIGESEPDGQTPASAETRLVLPPIPDTVGLLDVLPLGALETRHAGPRISGWRAIIDRDRPRARASCAPRPPADDAP